MATISEGLNFVSVGDGTCYVSGIGRCNDTDVIIPERSPDGDSVTMVGSSAFSHCESLTSIAIPASVISLGDDAFSGCLSLESVTFAKGSQLTSIGHRVFEECSFLASITIPTSVTSIGDYAFSGCNSLASVTFEDGSQLTSISNYAFFGCDSLTSITIPASVTTIGNDAFYFCGLLTSVTFEDGSQLTSIGANVFYECNSLTSIMIPASVTSIGSYAFLGCALATVYYGGTEEQWSKIDSRNNDELFSAEVVYESKQISGIWLVHELQIIKGILKDKLSVAFTENVTFRASHIGTSLEPATFYGTAVEFFADGYKLHYERVDSIYKYPSPGELDMRDYAGFSYVVDFGQTPQPVSSQFYELFASIALKDDYAEIPAGVYRINDTITDFPYEGTWICAMKYTCCGHSTGNGKLYKAYASGYLVCKEATGTHLAVIEYMCEPEYPEKGAMFVYTHMDNKYWDDWVYDDPSVITVSENTVVTSSFKAWFEANSKPLPAVAINYNGQLVAGLLAGQTGTLKCNGMTMKAGDVEIIVPEGFGETDSFIEDNFPADAWAEGEYTYYIDDAPVLMRYKYRKGNEDPKNIPLTGVLKDVESDATVEISNLADFYTVRLWAGATMDIDGDMLQVLENNAVVPVYFDCSAAVEVDEGVDAKLTFTATQCGMHNYDEEGGYVKTIVNYRTRANLSGIDYSNPQEFNGAVMHYEWYCDYEKAFVGESEELLRALYKKKPNLQSKSVTPSAVEQRVVADDGCDGLSEVVVEGDDALTPENIADGVEIFGVTGTHKGGGSTGGGTSKLPQVIDKTVTELTAEDLQGATKIGDYAFKECTSLKSIEIPASVTSIGDYAFAGDDGTPMTLGTVTFAESNQLTTIGNNAFAHCKKLVSIEIPTSVTSIGSYAFWWCDSLASIEIPASVTSIGKGAFSACGSLKKVRVKGAPPTIEIDSFENVHPDFIIEVDAGMVNTFINTTNWNVYAQHIRAEGATLDPDILDENAEWLVEGEIITGAERYDLKLTTKPGKSYTAFVNGVKIGTGIDDGTQVIFYYEADDVRLVCEWDLGYWKFDRGNYYATVYVRIDESGDEPVEPEEPDTPGGNEGGNTGGSTGGWLIGNSATDGEYIDSDGRSDLDAPTPGVSYTLFVDGVEKLTNTAEFDPVTGVYLSFRDYEEGLVFLYNAGRWYFDTDMGTVSDGSVSIRSNVSGGGWLFGESETEGVRFELDDNGNCIPSTEITSNPEDGVSYTLFYDGVAVDTKTASFHPGDGCVYLGFNFLGMESLSYDVWGWRASTVGTYSVRING